MPFLQLHFQSFDIVTRTMRVQIAFTINPRFEIIVSQIKEPFCINYYWVKGLTSQTPRESF